MRSPTTVGDPCPRPGMGAFQRMPSVSLHCTGGFCPEAAMPSRVGPRHAGQSFAGLIAERTAQVESTRALATPRQAIEWIFMFMGFGQTDSMMRQIHAREEDKAARDFGRPGARLPSAAAA